MKLFSAFLICFFILLKDSKAQNNTLDFGLVLSPSIEGFYNPAFTNSSLKYREKLSYNFGLKARYLFSKNFSFSSGVMIYNKGRTYTVPLASIPNQAPNFSTLSNSIWYLSVPLNIHARFSLKNRSSLGPNIGVVYGRKVFQYLHQVRKNYNFYTFRRNGASQNYFGLSLGLTYSTRINNKSVEISPSYVRQLNSGWHWTPESYPNSRFDSYILEFVFYGLFYK
jgi:hypothetical protein